MLDVAGREVLERLDLDLVDHRVEDLLAGPVTGADEHLHDHSLLVFRALVAEPDRRRLASGAELVRDHRVVEVERVQSAAHHKRDNASEAISRSPL